MKFMLPIQKNKKIEIREYHIRVPPFDLKVIHALNAQKNHVTENPLTLIQNNMT